MKPLIEQVGFLGTWFSSPPFQLLHKHLVSLLLLLGSVLIDDVLDQHLVRELAVAVLLALLVNAHGDARWPVRELHAVIGLVHFLPAMA